MNRELREALPWRQDDELILGHEQKIWRSRIAAMSYYISSDDKSVMAIGAGSIQIKQLLAEDVRYISVDYKKTAEDTLVYDFNKYEFPDEKIDVIVAAGILEHISDPEWFLNRITESCNKLILSYKGREAFAEQMLYTSEIIDYLKEKGFIITQREQSLGEYWTLIACFEKMVPEKLSKSTVCTGCGACTNSCGEHALEMHYDSNGFLKPICTVEKCISCGKCIQVCPTLKPVIKETFSIDCYAAWASDEIRMQSSSGGVFSVIANYVITHNGYVFGAAWEDGMYCHHQGISKLEDIPKLRHSKYVQSNTGNTFCQVKELLKQGILVAYIGCPCQIAGLKAYLGKQYNNKNLLTIDVVCFCVPSNQVFRRYLDETYGIENVKNVIFRDKEKGQSPVGYRVELTNGDTLFPSVGDDAYHRAFHGVLARNDVCEDCQFADFPRQGDITIGDFWGINQHDPSWEDGRGTSLILTNTESGKDTVNKIADQFSRIEKVPLEWCLGKGNRFANDGRKGHKNREYFKQMLLTKTFAQSVDAALKDTYDIGVVCFQNRNIGNNLTNYALYQLLKDKGYTICMIDIPEDTMFAGMLAPIIPFELFLKNPYPAYAWAAKRPDRRCLEELNSQCSFFVVGSDQIWRSRFVKGTDYHSCLPWVKSAKYKMSYGTSFGVEQFEDDGDIKDKMKFYLNRFQNISVREQSGVDILNKTFQAKAECVLDPVLMCNKKYYEEMAKIGTIRQTREAFIGAYILDMTKEKEAIIKCLAFENTNNRYELILDTDGALYSGQYGGELSGLSEPSIEEWLAMIKNCEFFITDSVLGICFALLFQKEFCVVFSPKSWRGIERIKNILKLVHLEERLVAIDDMQAIHECYSNKIDYSTVNRYLEIEQRKSMQWLEKALNEADTFIGNYDTYDMYCEMHNDMQKKYYKNRQEQFILQKVLQDMKFRSMQRRDKAVNIVGWGTGVCFRRNIGQIKEFSNMKYVVDSDPQKWGRSFEGVTCISPKELEKMQDVLVIIMVDSTTVAFEIVKSIMQLGISQFEYVVNYLEFIKQ